MSIYDPNLPVEVEIVPNQPQYDPNIPVEVEIVPNQPQYDPNLPETVDVQPSGGAPFDPNRPGSEKAAESKTESESEAKTAESSKT